MRTGSRSFLTAALATFVLVGLVLALSAPTQIAGHTADRANASIAASEVDTARVAESLSSAAGAPSCPVDQLPVLQTGPRLPITAGGAVSPDSALRRLKPDIGSFAAYPWFGAASARGPVWFVASTETFIATALPDGTWVATTARFVGCRSLPANGRP